MPTAAWSTSNNAYGTPEPISSTSGAQAHAATSAAANAGSGYKFGQYIGEFWNRISGTEASNALASEQAAAQRQWEQDMDNTKYQRAVADMQAAGINPATLSGVSSGSVGSVPSGAAASTHSPGTNPLNALIAFVGALVLRNSSTKSQALNGSRSTWPSYKGSMNNLISRH